LINPSAVSYNFVLHVCKSSVLILVVLLLRVSFRRISGKIPVLLWSFTAFYLMCPFRIPFPVSAYNLIENEYLFVEQNKDVSSFGQYFNLFILLWFLIFLFMFIYGLSGLLRLRKVIRFSVPQANQVRICEGITSPFLWGFINPVIYLPVGLDINQTGYIISHENSHIKQGDQWRKAIGYLVLCLYWFNPLVWFAFHLFCKDLEILCDENTIESFTVDQRKAYAITLIEYSSRKSHALSYPLAFGESAVRERLQRIISYREPDINVRRISLIICLICTAVFMTEPYRQIRHAERMQDVSFADDTFSIKYEDALEQAVTLAEIYTQEGKLSESATADSFFYKGAVGEYTIVEGISYYLFEISADVTFSDRGVIEKTYMVRVNAMTGQAEMMGWSLN